MKLILLTLLFISFTQAADLKIYILIIIVLLILIAILTIKIKKQKDEENIIEAVQDIAQTNELNFVTNKIVEEPKEYVKVTQDGTRKNNSDKITSAKMVGNLIISNISLTSDGKDTFFTADVKSTGKIHEEIKLKITLLKEDGNEWITFYGFVSKADNGTIGKINIKISDADFTNAYDLKIDIE